ncbi:MAG: gamma-glutamyltransferase [Acidobacteriota bacterium]
MRVSVTAALAVSAAGSLVAVAGDRPEGRALATRSVVAARHGMVAAAHPIAVHVGVDVLKRGGSAVDAAIAVNAALALMEPVSCGPGGDLFALVWDPRTATLHGLNASGRAPLALTPEKVAPETDGTIPEYSPFAWTVPGAVDGWFELHRRFGRLPMADVLGPAAAYAREGVPVPQVIAGAWARGARLFAGTPGFADVFMPGGRAPRENEPFANPALARTFDLLVRGGRDAYYRGEIAREIVAYSRRVGGFFALEDFENHASAWVEPISTTYRGWQVWEIPPNGQGLAALQMLNILERHELGRLGRDNADYWHLLVEAKKLAYADRARYIADPDVVPVPVDGLLSKQYATTQARRIDMSRAAPSVDPGVPDLPEGDTTYLATADSQGMMVSLIQSNYTGFGSGHAIPALGFGLQDRGAQFSLKAGHPNVLAPGKRPFHTIIPAFLGKAGVPFMAFGVMGGDMQPQGHVQVVVNLVDHAMNLQEAGDAPRFHHTGSSEPTGTTMTGGGALHLESAIPADVRRELLRRGHRIVETTGTSFGGYQAVWRDPVTGVLLGASESRKDGCAMGY